MHSLIQIWIQKVITLFAVKGKVLPRTGHEGPEGQQRYSSTLSLTSAVDGSGCSTPRPGRFTPGKETRYPLPLFAVFMVSSHASPVSFTVSRPNHQPLSSLRPSGTESDVSDVHRLKKNEGRSSDPVKTSQSVCLSQSESRHNQSVLGLMTRYLSGFEIRIITALGSLSDERASLSFVSYCYKVLSQVRFMQRLTVRQCVRPSWCRALLGVMKTQNVID